MFGCLFNSVEFVEVVKIIWLCWSILESLFLIFASDYRHNTTYSARLLYPKPFINKKSFFASFLQTAIFFNNCTLSPCNTPSSFSSASFYSLMQCMYRKQDYCLFERFACLFEEINSSFFLIHSTGNASSSPSFALKLILLALLLPNSSLAKTC